MWKKLASIGKDVAGAVGGWWAALIVALLSVFLLLMGRKRAQAAPQPDMPARELVRYLIDNHYISRVNGPIVSKEVRLPTFLNAPEEYRWVSPVHENDIAEIGKLEIAMGRGDLVFWAREDMHLELETMVAKTMRTLTIKHWAGEILFLRDNSDDMKPPHFLALKGRNPPMGQRTVEELMAPPEYEPPVYVDVHFNRSEIIEKWKPAESGT